MPAPGPGLKRVPRWRTMISPPVTTWPANSLTPRRCAAESRPLRLEPRPFLCAIRCLLLRGRLARQQLHLLDLEPRQLRPVSLSALVAALRLELEHADLLAALVARHYRLDLHLRELARIEDRVVARVQERLEGDRVARLGGQAVDDERVTLLDAVLLSADSDDCVHSGR